MKLITDYEVEGSWISESSVGKINCMKCGAFLELVPKTGHYNSKYWKLDRNDHCKLVCCPNGCSEFDARQAYANYRESVTWCKKGSKSWNWELDLLLISYAWITRHGRIIPCYLSGHEDVADRIGVNSKSLESKGWMKISSKEIIYDFSFSKYSSPSKEQWKTLFDYCTAHNILSQYKELEKYFSG